MTELLTGLDVSRETLVDLKAYEALVQKWSPKINLVSKSALNDLWARHIVDSAQVWPLLPSTKTYVDLGSGGGFPSIVIAIFLKHLNTDASLTMIESDVRKTVFLQTVIRELELPATTLPMRIEKAPSQQASVLTARALASCDKLFGFAHQHLVPDGTAFFLKGQKAEDELAEARQNWDFSVKYHPSKTDTNAVILEIGELHRV
ncbi:MAG: 16S rRNA (guanine(527)-N(7))-methyltransferase RsmG [Rhodobacteraceae bacterium]|nr:16S rRNA (guanine(527)-N(7))-methyltransferase RsmG [Paracoccaceae bacterium]